MSTNDEERPFDWFELIVAVLLGLGAVGSAWAAYQGDQWGGQEAEAFGEASTLATRASTVFNLNVTELMRDIQLDIDAKKLVAEGLFTEDPATKTRVYVIASYLYAQQMSDAGYAVIGLDPRYRTPEGREGIDHIPEEELVTTLERELIENEGYVTAMLAMGTEAFDHANTRFDEGREAGGKADAFSVVGVLYTVALFLAGIALVFKGRVRWAFVALGAAMFALSTVELFAAPWAEDSPPDAEAAPAATTESPAAAPPAP
jgi:hypothetical protein